MSRPRIAVTGKPGCWAPGWSCAGLAILLACGWPVRATPNRAWPARIEGVVIGGGDDIATDWYAAASGSIEALIASAMRSSSRSFARPAPRAGRCSVLAVAHNY